MTVKRSEYPGWDNYPVYYCKEYMIYKEIFYWMWKNEVDFEVLTTGTYGYKFQVKSRHDWFVLRWLQ